MNRAFDHSKYSSWIDPNRVKPYERNAKIHTAEQVKNIANSIRRFGWQQDVVITSDFVLVIGHGRRLAAIQIGCEMPYHVIDKKAEDLTDKDIRELRIVDNKVSEGGWDLDTLGAEIGEITFDGFDFDFDIELQGLDEGTEKDEESLPSRLNHNCFENFDHEFVPRYTGEYGIPEVDRCSATGSHFLRFCDWRETDNHGDLIAHFYYDDFKFAATWWNPEKYVDRLRDFRAVVAPDFSLYTDFPKCLQILSCYRRNWIAAYWQSLGLNVIPDVVWGDESTYEFCFDGLPTGGTVAVSSLGVTRDNEWNGKENEIFRAGYMEMMKRLEPDTVLYYGTLLDGLEGNIIRIPTFYEQRRGGLPGGKRQELKNNFG